MMKGLFSTKALWPSRAPESGKRHDGSALPVVAVTFLVPAAVVTVLLLLVVRFQGSMEAAIADLALVFPFGYAFAAGMVASVNPCGILMLSSYAIYRVRGEADGYTVAGRLGRGLLVTVVVTLTFVGVFALVGLLVAAGGQELVMSFPAAGLVIGVLMIALGLWLLVSRQTLGFVPGKQLTFTPERNLKSAVLFGLTYSFASLSCTLPVFLVVVGSALAAGTWLASFGQFVAYALGMGLVILIVTLGAALARRAMARWLRVLAPHVHRLSAMFLLGAGAYLVYYWLT